MFSQSSLDSMSIEDLVKKIRSMTYSLENHLDNPLDAWNYCNALINLSESLRDRIDEQVEDVA